MMASSRFSQPPADRAAKPAGRINPALMRPCEFQTLEMPNMMLRIPLEVVGDGF
jgi:hypothetical protein